MTNREKYLYFYGSQDDEYMDEITADQYIPKKKQCECGKDKHGFASHLHWCPMYDPKNDGTGRI